MNPVLSILVCSVPPRGPQLCGLLYGLNSQAEACGRQYVEIIYLGDNKHMPVGLKRNWLLSMASGKYVCFVDDDDKVACDYAFSIVQAAVNDSDCILFDVEISENGGPWKKVKYNLSFLVDANLPDHFERIPNHLMAIKRDIVLSGGAPFPADKSCGEDFAYAKLIRPRLKTQTVIEKTLYWYCYNSKTSETPRS